MSNKMSIHLITLAAFPYHSAESIHLAMFSKAMAQLCHFKLVTPIKPWRPKTWSSQLLMQYGIPNNAFNTKKILQLDKTGRQFINKALQQAAKDNATVYARQYAVAVAAVSKNMPTIWEIHSLPSLAELHFIKANLSDSLKWIVVISHALKEDILKMADIPPSLGDRVIVAPDAADQDKFKPTSLNVNKPKIGYVGSSFPGKGIEIVVPLAKILNEIPFEIYGIDESDEALKAYQPLPKNITWHGKIPYADIPKAMETFDIALLPNQPSVVLSNGVDIGKYTSPMKMFEYMASGKIIVASDLPIIREIISPDVHGILATHDNPNEWACKIQSLIIKTDTMAALAANAQSELVSKYTYLARAKNILREIS